MRIVRRSRHALPIILASIAGLIMASVAFTVTLYMLLLALTMR